MWFYLFLILTNFILQVPGYEIRVNEVCSWESDHPYTEYQNLTIFCPNSKSIEIIVDEVDVAGKDKDLLKIIPDDLDSEGLIFTYNLKQPRKYVFHVNELNLEFQVNGVNADKLYGFHLTYQCSVEETVTTTESASTEIDWPIPAPNDKIYYTVNVSGLHYTKYDENQIEKFRTAVKNMAKEYCETQNFVLSSEITTSNVLISLIKKCPYNWPDSNTCVQIKFALPIFLNDTMLGYQLKAEHLEIMWLRLSNKCLKSYKLEMYTLIEETSVTIWIVTASIVLLLFAIFLILARYIFNKLRGDFRKINNVPNELEDEKRRTSGKFLYPHPLQLTPSFYEPDVSYFEVN